MTTVPDHGVGRTGREQPHGEGGFLFRGGVRLWHFIALPTVAMGLLILTFRWVDSLGGTHSTSLQYQVVRGLVITVTMASLIAWLAFRHRREYETRIRLQNQDLEATRDFLSKVIETSGEGIFTLDGRCLVTSWNHSAEEIYGWSAEEMLGEDPERLLPADPAIHQEFREMGRLLRDGETIKHHETRRVRKDGREIVVHVTASPLFDSSGKFVGSTALVHDVTELKQLQEQVVEQERLAALGQMAATLAHEVKNPLAGIRGACEILTQGFDDRDPRSELGVEVLRQVDRLNRTTHDLLAFARPKTAKPVATDIHTVLERVLSVVLEDPDARNVEVVRNYHSSPPLLEVDPRQMEQIFFNLLLNALQATGRDGIVTVTTEPNSSHFRVRVGDTGPGIPPGIAERIFEPFFTTRTKGTGLGLAIVSKIVAAHQGAVSVTSPVTDGRGTEFVVTLPMEN